MMAFWSALLGMACSPGGGAQPAPTSKPEGAASQVKQWSSSPTMSIDANKEYSATISTNLGQMKAQLFPKEAPNTVNNFVFLARQGFYSGVPFHRIIAGFMVQTGDPTGTGRGGPGYRFADELSKERGYEKGSLAMANAGPNTQGSQFFIVHGRQGSQLPKNYTIFGQLTDGLDVLDRIANVPVGQSPTGERSAPTQDVRITSVAIDER